METDEGLLPRKTRNERKMVHDEAFFTRIARIPLMVAGVMKRT